MTIKAERPFALSPSLSLFSPTFLLAFNVSTQQTFWHWIDFFFFYSGLQQHWNTAPTLRLKQTLICCHTIVSQSVIFLILFRWTVNLANINLPSSVMFMIFKLTQPAHTSPKLTQTLCWPTCCHIRYHLWSQAHHVMLQRRSLIWCQSVWRERGRQGALILRCKIPCHLHLPQPLPHSRCGIPPFTWPTFRLHLADAWGPVSTG